MVLRIPTLPGWEDFPLRDTPGATPSACRWCSRTTASPRSTASGGTAPGAGRGTSSSSPSAPASAAAPSSTAACCTAGAAWRRTSGTSAWRRTARSAPAAATGCFEAFAAGPALARRARAAAATGGYLAKIAAGREVETRDVVAGARAGDAACRALIDEEADYLGQGFTGLIQLFSPDLLVMGGGVSNAFDLMSDRIHAVIRRDAMQPFKAVPVVRAALGDNAGLVGAAALAIERTRGEG